MGSKQVHNLVKRETAVEYTLILKTSKLEYTKLRYQKILWHSACCED